MRNYNNNNDQFIGRGEPQQFSNYAPQQQNSDGNNSNMNNMMVGAPPPGYEEIMRQSALRSSQKYQMGGGRVPHYAQQQQQQMQQNPAVNVGPHLQNGSSPPTGNKGQWITQTASTRYMSSSSQNYLDNDAPRIEQAQMLDMDDQLVDNRGGVGDHDGVDFMNLNNQLDDNSINDQEGGAEDNQDFNGLQQQQQEQQHTMQYIPYNMRKERYMKEEQEEFLRAAAEGQNDSEESDEDDDHSAGRQRPNLNRFSSNEMTNNQNNMVSNQQRNSQGGSAPKNSGNGAEDPSEDGGKKVQSHEQITVEIEMIEQQQAKGGKQINSTESSRSSSQNRGSSRDRQTSDQHFKQGGMPIQNLQMLDDHMGADNSGDMRHDLMQDKSRSEDNDEEDEDDGQSLNDRQEDDQASQGQAQSDKISNKEQTPSANGEDDEEEEDEEDTASLDSIDKLQNILNEINDQCIEHLKNEETDQALENLKRAEQILEDYTNEGKDVDRNMIIIILYNQACCYQRLSMLDDCSNYLDGTIFNLQQKLLNFEEQDQEIRDMINEAEDRGYPGIARQANKAKKRPIQHAYGYDDEDDQMDNAADSNPYEVQDYDQYGLQKGKAMAGQQDRKNKNYNLSSLSIQNNNKKFDDGLSAHGAQSEQSHDFQDLNDIQEPSDHYNDTEALAEIESSKKLSISQKLFKLRYLCKCHLQLCAVQSQLNKHKDALHHGQMASVYCQELIRNSKVLCEGYIGEILGRKKKDDQQQYQNISDQNKSITSKDDAEKDSKKSDKDNLGNKLKENYYLEDDAKLLDVLIKNCHPILTDMLKQVDNFNQYNEITENSKKAQVREHDILKGLRMEVANTEFDQDLMQLIESKEHFSINVETKQNIERFKVYEAELRKKGYKSDQQLNKSSMKGDIFLQLESEEKQMSRKNSRKSIGGKKANAKHFVDEMAPNQPQFELSRASNSKARDIEEHDVYFKNDDQLNSSMNSAGTYGQFNPNFQAAGIGPQGYLKLRDNVKTVLVTQEEDDWIFNLNIGNVMHLQPLSSEQMNLHIDNSHELSRDAMLEKIILLTVSYFCVGTELRFLNNNSSSNDDKIDPLNKTQKDKQSELEKDKKKKKELSEMWHAQALEASARFLPSECPLVAHVITNYQKHHSPALTIIPEDEELQEDLRVVRPLNEVKNDNINYYQIIRNHLKIERRPRSPKKSSNKKAKERGRNGLPNKMLSNMSETPEPIAVNPKAIRGPERQNFLDKEQQIMKLQADQQQQQQKQKILVNDFQFDPNQPDNEPFSPDDFNCEEFVGKDMMDNRTQMQPLDMNKDNADQINFYPQNDMNGNENIAGSSDDADAMIQLVEHREHFESIQSSSDRFDQQATQQQNSQKQLTAAKSTNQLKTKKMPKSPGSLQQSLSGTNFQNTQQFKIPSGMQFLQNKQDTQRSTGRIKIKKTVGGGDGGKQGRTRDTLANRNQNSHHVNSTGLTRIGSIKQRLKMMPSTKSTKMIKSGSTKKPMNAGGQPGQTIKKIGDGNRSNQQSSQLSKQKKSQQNLRVQPGQLNNFASTSKLQTMKSFSPSASNQMTLNPAFGQANLVNNNPNSKKNIQSSKQLKQYINTGQKTQKPPTQQNYGSQRKQSQSGGNGQQNQMSIAQNIQKITQVLSQKISSMSQSLGNSSRQNSKARQEETPQQNESLGQKFSKPKEGKRKTSENQTNEISSDDDAEANIDNELANDISAERPGNGPAQKIRILHNVPKVSGSNLMIKTKAQMHFQQQKGGFMNMPQKGSMSNQMRTGSGTRMTNQGSFRPSLTNSSNHNTMTQNQNQQNKRLAIKVVGQKKGSVAVQDPANSLKINTNMMSGGGKPPANVQMRTPQNQIQTRLMPSTVNNFSTQNNMYHRALLQQHQQQQQQSNSMQQNLQRQQSFPINNGPGQPRKSNASTGSGSNKFDDRVQNKQNQILIAQQNIKNIQSNLIQRNNNVPQQKQQHQNRDAQDQQTLEDRGAMSPSAASNGLNNTNCNVTASLNNISGLSNIMQSAPGTAGGQQRMSSHQKLGNQMQMMQQQPSGGAAQQQQQINRLPISTQKFRQPMRIMKFKK